MYQQHTNTLTRDLKTDRDINKTIEELNRSILQTAKLTIPRGARKNYKPHWNKELEMLHNEVEEARKQAEITPCQIKLNNFQQY